MTDEPPYDRTPEPEPSASDTFASLGISPGLVATLSELGYEEPTPIQREAIPVLLAGRDMLAEAPTGTGKTAAFALPMLERLGSDGRSGAAARALVLVPTRELAVQVAEAIHRYGQSLRTRVLPVYGGQAIHQQLRSLQRGVDVVVATPGRAVDHITRGSLRLDAVELVVLDEADEMLDMGFAEDLDAVLTATPAERQTALFSATISVQIARIAKRHLREPVRVTVKPERREKDSGARVRQVAYVVRRADKPTALGRILDLEDPTSALVFARTRGEVDELAEKLAGHGHDTAALHGGMAQEQRDRVLGRFREGALDVLVATDVAARGLDIEHLSHVINYDIPSNPDAYIHRIGRTGRAGREGVAITLVEPREQRLLRNIETAMRTRMELGRIPTIADLREHRLEVLRAQLREALMDDGLERFRGVVEPLTEEFDVLDIALAAVSLAQSATERDGPDETEIASVGFFDDRRGQQRGPSAGFSQRGPSAGVSQRGQGGESGRTRPGPDRRPAGPDTRWTRLFIGAGRNAGLRPGDLVGAITNEAGVPGSAIGAIQIGDRSSLVDVAESAADDIVRAMSRAAIRGKKVPVRRDRDDSGG